MRREGEGVGEGDEEEEETGGGASCWTRLKTAAARIAALCDTIILYPELA